MYMEYTNVIGQLTIVNGLILVQNWYQLFRIMLILTNEFHTNKNGTIRIRNPIYYINYKKNVDFFFWEYELT